jgi:hypothetical protein
LPLEEGGDTLADIGEFAAALSAARDPASEDYRRTGVLLVLVIELFWDGRFAVSQALLTELESSNLGPWERIVLALFFANQEPWCGYPYPDW